jgi:hypothetical protein
MANLAVHRGGELFVHRRGQGMRGRAVAGVSERQFTTPA